jgi:hypothetical protein
MQDGLLVLKISMGPPADSEDSQEIAIRWITNSWTEPQLKMWHIFRQRTTVYMDTLTLTLNILVSFIICSIRLPQRPNVCI